MPGVGVCGGVGDSKISHFYTQSGEQGAVRRAILSAGTSCLGLRCFSRYGTIVEVVSRFVIHHNIFIFSF